MKGLIVIVTLLNTGTRLRRGAASVALASFKSAASGEPGGLKFLQGIRFIAGFS